jgi:hypothetical protein
MPQQHASHRSQEPRGSRRPSRQRWWGSLRGGAAVGIVAAAAAVGAVVTIAHRAQPGRVLGVCIVVGTVIAALAVRPRSGRLIFPVPVLSYLVAAFTAGIVYNRSTSKTELIIGAAQWIANGFLLMALATSLAIVLVTGRWILQRRDQPPPAVPDRFGSAAEISRQPRGVRDEYATAGDRRDRRAPVWSDRGSSGVSRQPGPQPGQRPSGLDGPDQRNRPYPDQQYGQSRRQRPGQGYGQYPGQRPSQGNQPRTGPGSGQSPGQRNGPRPGQDYGQYPQQRNGQDYRQYPQQRNGQGYGQYSGQGNGSDPDQRTGQRYGTYPDQRNAP